MQIAGSGDLRSSRVARSGDRATTIVHFGSDQFQISLAVKRNPMPVNIMPTPLNIERSRKSSAAPSVKKLVPRKAPAIARSLVGGSFRLMVSTQTVASQKTIPKSADSSRKTMRTHLMQTELLASALQVQPETPAEFVGRTL